MTVARNWASIAAVADTWRRLRESLRELPPRTWRRWFTTVFIGWIICATLTVALTKFAQSRAPKGMDDWDASVLRSIERGPISFQNAVLLESPGNLIYLIPLTFVAAVVAIRWRRPVFAITMIAGYWLARTHAILGWQLWDRPRPRLIAGGIAAPPLHSFPSGHTLLALAVYGLLAYAWWQRSRSVIERALIAILAAAWCGATGFARVRLGSHWPTDVVAGAIIGLAWLAVLIFALHRSEPGSSPGGGAYTEDAP